MCRVSSDTIYPTAPLITCDRVRKSVYVLQIGSRCQYYSIIYPDQFYPYTTVLSLGETSWYILLSNGAWVSEENIHNTEKGWKCREPADPNTRVW